MKSVTEPHESLSESYKMFGYLDNVVWMSPTSNALSPTHLLPDRNTPLINSAHKESFQPSLIFASPAARQSVCHKAVLSGVAT